MPVTRHVERHFTSGETVRDILAAETREVTDVLGSYGVSAEAAAAAFGIARAIA
jgi:hypothetical protein